MNSFAVPIPPVEEQKLIVAHVKEMRDALRAGRKLVEGSIIKLREFRLALVSAAVTGQINIRNYRPQEASSICQ